MKNLEQSEEIDLNAYKELDTDMLWNLANDADIQDVVTSKEYQEIQVELNKKLDETS